MTRPRSLNWYNAQYGRAPSWVPQQRGTPAPIGAMLPQTAAYPPLLGEAEAGSLELDDANEAMAAMPSSLRRLIECVGSRVGFGVAPNQSATVEWFRWATTVADSVGARVPQSELEGAWRSIVSEEATIEQACGRIVEQVDDITIPVVSNPPSTPESEGSNVGWYLVGGGLALAALAGLVISMRRKPARRRNPTRRSKAPRRSYFYA